MQKLRLLHTADWHIGKYLKHFSRIEEQKQMLDEINRIAQAYAVDIILIAGDVYDNYKPTNEAERILLKGLFELSQQGKRLVFLIAGNHDSPDRISNLSIFGSATGIFGHGHPGKTDAIDHGIHIGAWYVKQEGDIFHCQRQSDQLLFSLIATPFVNEIRIGRLLPKDQQLAGYLKNYWQNLVEKLPTESIRIIMAHQFVVEDRKRHIMVEDEAENKIVIGGSEAISPETFPKAISYAALGHLHRPHQVAQNHIRYSGSPLAYSFDERTHQKSIFILEATPGGIQHIQSITLQSGRRLIEQEINTADEMRRFLDAQPNALFSFLFRFQPKETDMEWMKSEERIIKTQFTYKTTEATNPADESYLFYLNQQEVPIEDIFTKFYLDKYHKNPPKEIMEAFRKLLYPASI